MVVDLHSLPRPDLEIVKKPLYDSCKVLTESYKVKDSSWLVEPFSSLSEDFLAKCDSVKAAEGAKSVLASTAWGNSSKGSKIATVDGHYCIRVSHYSSENELTFRVTTDYLQLWSSVRLGFLWPRCFCRKFCVCAVIFRV